VEDGGAVEGDREGGGGDEDCCTVVSPDGRVRVGHSCSDEDGFQFSPINV
jgi:hypothetical protein